MSMNRKPLRATTPAWRVLAALIVAVSLAGCGSTPDRSKANRSAEVLYDDARQEAAAGAWDAAVRGYEAVQARSPFGRLAQQAMMEQAYAQWRAGDSAQAEATIDRFIKQYPNHVAIDYMYYLRGLVNYHDGSGFFDKLTGQDPAERDPKALRDSFDAFKELVTRYPESDYVPDATARMQWLANALAAHEVHVARYYFRRGAYVAALNRAQIAVKEFNGSPTLDEALAIMRASYDKLGMAQERDDADRVLKTNFPESPFTAVNSIDRKQRKWWQFW